LETGENQQKPGIYFDILLMVELGEVVVAKRLVFQPGPSELSNGPMVIHYW
jgi:hypothetical protein